MLPLETLLDVLAFADYATIVCAAFVSGSFNRLVAAKAGQLARQRCFQLHCSKITTGSEGLFFTLREESCDGGMKHFMSNGTLHFDCQSVAEGLQGHRISRMTAHGPLAVKNYAELFAVLRQPRFAENLKICRSKRLRRRDIQRLIDGFIAPFRCLKSLELASSANGYFSASILDFLCGDTIRRIPEITIELHPDYVVDREKEDVVFRFCFDFTMLPADEEKFVTISGLFSNEFCRRVIQVTRRMQQLL